MSISLTMLIGSGLLVHAFSRAFLQREDVCIYAAGVSNSSCTDTHEFARECQRLGDALVGNRAVYDVVDRGSEYLIDISAIFLVLEKAGVKFGNDYLEKVIDRYYNYNQNYQA